MCGIAGLIHHGNLRENMEAMKHRMAHRGPDANGTWISDDHEVCLGHQRLAIMDLSDNGAQPMLSHSGRMVMVFNGEIYNYRELQEKLKADGMVSEFRSTCDTEALLEAIEHYGMTKTLKLCRGMFAIAVYDTREHVLQLARDRIGEKPLYYGFVGQSFAFASDIGSIAAIEDFHNGINRRVLNLYFRYGYIPAPYSVYEGIGKVMPGTIVTLRAPFTENMLQTGCYWSLRETAVRGQKNLFRGSRSEAADELERLLKRAVASQMSADVPLGAFLSAGTDSSTIVSLMQAQSSRKVKSFTIGMDDPAYNEAAYAAEIAARIGTDHTTLMISERDAKDVIPLLPYMFSEPFADSSQIPTFLVSKLTRRFVTVSLSGDAGDELFCGYRSYPSVERKWGKIRRIPLPVRRTAGRLLLRTGAARSDMARIKSNILMAASPEEVYRLDYETDPLVGQLCLEKDSCTCAFDDAGRDETGEVNHDIMLLDLRMYHPDDILVKVDRTAMAVSLETRVPFLDRDLVEFGWSLPADYLRDCRAYNDPAAYEHTVGKLVLKDVLYRYVPKELLTRPKKGFSVPLAKWLAGGELRSWADGLLDPAAIRSQGFLNEKAVTAMWRDFTERGIWRVQIWYVLMFQAWLQSVRCGGRQELPAFR